ncbi:hypothetical protein C0989_004681 [Termitomyces sp. Mn162]|nr:hypothetical protein C0989_004681 [Termitomyces sp. Mn162]
MGEESVVGFIEEKAVIVTMRFIIEHEWKMGIADIFGNPCYEAVDGVTTVERCLTSKAITMIDMALLVSSCNLLELSVFVHQDQTVSLSDVRLLQNEVDGCVTTCSLKPHTPPDKPPLPPPQRFVELPQHSVPTPANSGTFSANSDSPLANSDVFPAAAGASPGLPEPLGPLPHCA